MSEATLDTSALSELDDLDVEGEAETETDTETPDASADDLGDTPEPADAAAADGPARDEHGRFTAKAEKEAATAAAQPIESVQPTATQPEWKPFVFRSKGQDVPLEGVHFTQQDGHVVLATPEQQFSRVRDLIQRGRLYEEREQEFVARERTLREKESAPRPPSEAEIEAKVVLEYLKPHLPNLLNEADLQWLADKVKLANLEAGTAAAKAKEEFASKEAEAAKVGEFREHQLAVWLDDLAKRPVFAGKLSEQELKEFYDDLQPYAAQFLDERNPGKPLHERYVFRDDLLTKELEKRVRRAALARTTATKVTEAAKFNAAQQPKPAAQKARTVVATTPAEKPKAKTGKRQFDDAFRQWGKRSDLSFSDDEEE